jgi:hypothetical protein
VTVTLADGTQAIEARIREEANWLFSIIGQVRGDQMYVRFMLSIHRLLNLGTRFLNSRQVLSSLCWCAGYKPHVALPAELWAHLLQQAGCSEHLLSLTPSHIICLVLWCIPKANIPTMGKLQAYVLPPPTPSHLRPMRSCRTSRSARRWTCCWTRKRRQPPTPPTPPTTATQPALGRMGAAATVALLAGAGPTAQHLAEEGGMVTSMMGPGLTGPTSSVVGVAGAPSPATIPSRSTRREGLVAVEGLVGGTPAPVAQGSSMVEVVGPGTPAPTTPAAATTPALVSSRPRHQQPTRQGKAPWEAVEPTEPTTHSCSTLQAGEVAQVQEEEEGQAAGQGRQGSTAGGLQPAWGVAGLLTVVAAAGQGHSVAAAASPGMGPSLPGGQAKLSGRRLRGLSRRSSSSSSTTTTRAGRMRSTTMRRWVVKPRMRMRMGEGGRCAPLNVDLESNTSHCWTIDSTD